MSNGNKTATVATATATATGTVQEVVVVVAPQVTKSLQEVNKAISTVENRREALFLCIGQVAQERKYDRKQASAMLKLSYLATASYPTNPEKLKDETDEAYSVRLAKLKADWEKNYLLAKSAEISKTITLALPDEKTAPELKKAMEYNATLPKNGPSHAKIGYKDLYLIANGKDSVESILKAKEYSKPQGSAPSQKSKDEQTAKAQAQASTTPENPTGTSAAGIGTTGAQTQPVEAQAKAQSPREKLQGVIAGVYVNFRTNFGMSNEEISEVISEEVRTYAKK